MIASPDGSTGGASGGVSDWSRATDWVSLGGNARHTGYVPVTIDPSRLKLAWTKANFRAVVAARGAVISALKGDSAIVAVDPATGSVKWAKPAQGAFSVATPAISGGTAYWFVGGGDNHGFWSASLADGKGVGPLASPIAVTLLSWGSLVPSGSMIVGGTLSGAGGVVGFDPVSGASRFIFSGMRSLSTPVVQDGSIVSFGSASAAGISRADASGTTTLAREDAQLLAATSATLTDNGRLIGTLGGRVVAADPATGALRWQHGTDYLNAGLKAAKGLIFACAQRRLDALNETDGSLAWSWTPTDEFVPCAEAVTDNLLFVVGQQKVYAIDLATHSPVWSYPGTGSLIISPDGYVLFGGTAIAAR